MKPTLSIQTEKAIAVLLGVIYFFLITRFFFLFAGVDAHNSFVEFVYTVSNSFLFPFQGVTAPEAFSNESVLDWSPLFAAFIYTFIFQMIESVYSLIHSIHSYILNSNKESVPHSSSTSKQVETK